MSMCLSSVMATSSLEMIMSCFHDHVVAPQARFQYSIIISTIQNAFIALSYKKRSACVACAH
jgi:hypothetical protein